MNTVCQAELMCQVCTHCRELVVKAANDARVAWWREAMPELCKDIAELSSIDCDKLKLRLPEDRNRPQGLPLAYNDFWLWQNMSLISVYVLVLVLLALVCRYWGVKRHVQVQTSSTGMEKEPQQRSIASEVSCSDPTICYKQPKAKLSLVSEQPLASGKPSKSKRRKALSKRLKRSKANSAVVPEKSEVPCKPKELASEQTPKSALRGPKSLSPTTFERPFESVHLDDNSPQRTISDLPPKAHSPPESQRPTVPERPPIPDRPSISQPPPIPERLSSPERPSIPQPPPIPERPSKPAGIISADYIESVEKSPKRKCNSFKAWLKRRCRPILVPQAALHRQQNKYWDHETFKELNAQKTLENWTRAREQVDREL